jgi:hypothetical protein
MQEDVIATLQQHAARDQVGIISSGMRKTGTALDRALVPADSRFRSIVGGQMNALNVQLLDHALDGWDEWRGNLAVLTRMFACKLQRLPPSPTYERTPVSDEKILFFIRQQRVLRPSVGYSPLLRMFRDSGQACAQDRFKQLFNATRAEVGR